MQHFVEQLLHDSTNAIYIILQVLHAAKRVAKPCNNEHATNAARTMNRFAKPLPLENKKIHKGKYMMQFKFK